MSAEDQAAGESGEVRSRYPVSLPGTGPQCTIIKPSEEVSVPFAGVGAEVYAMSWGQKEIWLAMIKQRNWLPVGGVKPLDPGTTLQEVADELSYLVSRFPSMRTRLRYSNPGAPDQQLFGSGEVTLEVYDVEDAPAGTEPADLAAAVDAQYRYVPFNFADDWPVRMAVIRQHGRLTHMAVIMCHLVADGAGAESWLRDVAVRAMEPLEGMQQLDQAKWQNSPAGLRQNAISLKYWEKLLRTIPLRRLPDSTDKRRPQHWRAEYDSPALRAAVPMLAERTGASTSSVLLATFAVGLARITGINPVVTRTVVSNRFRAGLADVVCQVAQGGICALDIADISIDEAINRAQRTTITMFKHAYFDPEDIAALEDQVARDRGPDFDIACFVNDRRAAGVRSPELSPGTPISSNQAEESSQSDLTPDASTLRWLPPRDIPVDRLFVHIDDTDTGVMLTVCADTHYFSPAHIEALARGMEAVALETLADPAAPTRVETAAAHV